MRDIRPMTGITIGLVDAVCIPVSERNGENLYALPLEALLVPARGHLPPRDGWLSA